MSTLIMNIVFCLCVVPAAVLRISSQNSHVEHILQCRWTTFDFEKCLKFVFCENKNKMKSN
jgi:hypothetical protein